MSGRQGGVKTVNVTSIHGHKRRGMSAHTGQTHTDMCTNEWYGCVRACVHLLPVTYHVSTCVPDQVKDAPRIAGGRQDGVRKGRLHLDPAMQHVGPAPLRMPQKAVAAIRTEPPQPATNGYNYFSLLAVTNHRSYVGFLNQTAIADQVVWRFCKARRRRARQAVCCGCGVDVTLSRAATIPLGLTEIRPDGPIKAQDSRLPVSSASSLLVQRVRPHPAPLCRQNFPTQVWGSEACEGAEAEAEEAVETRDPDPRRLRMILSSSSENPPCLMFGRR
uniref:Uncharacterized protein n=1 Tax=Oryza nivara TaxID=4536 RepID=A0A0E0GUB9_ORYNI